VRKYPSSRGGVMGGIDRNGTNLILQELLRVRDDLHVVRDAIQQSELRLERLEAMAADVLDRMERLLHRPTKPAAAKSNRNA
jgi:DnaJ-domain-containing protein 1